MSKHINQNLLLIGSVLVMTTSFFVSFWKLNDMKNVRNEIEKIMTHKKTLGISVHKTNSGDPKFLWIPSLKVSSKIQDLGVTTTGEMDVPSDLTDVGWFDLGPKPGERGSAVIAGHLNGMGGEQGIFAHLDELKPGDRLYVKDNENHLFTFVVRESRDYDPGFAEEVFSSNDGVHLNLVTCDGVWNEKINGYNKRLVVFTDAIID